MQPPCEPLTHEECKTILRRLEQVRLPLEEASKLLLASYGESSELAYWANKGQIALVNLERALKKQIESDPLIAGQNIRHFGNLAQSSELT